MCVSKVHSILAKFNTAEDFYVRSICVYLCSRCTERETIKVTGLAVVQNYWKLCGRNFKPKCKIMSQMPKPSHPTLSLSLYTGHIKKFFVLLCLHLLLLVLHYPPHTHTHLSLLSLYAPFSFFPCCVVLPFISYLYSFFLLFLLSTYLSLPLSEFDTAYYKYEQDCVCIIIFVCVIRAHDLVRDSPPNSLWNWLGSPKTEWLDEVTIHTLTHAHAHALH